MSLKQEIETWVEALAHYDNNEFEEALKTFEPITDTSRILFNCGVIHATLGEHVKAVDCYQRAVQLDQYLAVAYFQQGVSNFLMGDFEEALANFNDALLYLRGNNMIDYEQLGLKFKLYSCEVLFNRGLCYIYLQQKDAGMEDFSYALKEKVVEDHNVIDEAIREEAEGYTVFSIPVGVVYRPNSAKVKNLKTKDYLGKARLVAATTRNNTYTGFSGPEIKKSMTLRSETPQDDRPQESISFAASNLVKPDLRSRTRLQSEPPLNRQVFPPTPPPDSDKSLPFARANDPERSGSVARSINSTQNELERFSFERRNMSGSVDLGRPAQISRTNTTISTDTDRLQPLSPSSRSDRTGGAESDKLRRPSRTDTEESSGAAMTQRAASVRSGHGRVEKPEALNLQSEVKERPRLGTLRTASEPRGPSRQHSGHRDYRPRMMSKERERDSPRRRMGSAGEETEEELSADRYDAYRSSRMKSYTRRGVSRQRAQPEFIEEEEYDKAGSDADDDPSPEDGEFEMIPPSQPASRPRRPVSRSVDIRKIRVKVHVGEDTRYIMLGSKPTFLDFIEHVREKFQLKGRFRCTVLDDGDRITMGDQDDLEMAVSTAKAAARREGVGMGKIEVWVVENA